MQKGKIKHILKANPKRVQGMLVDTDQLVDTVGETQAPSLLIPWGPDSRSDTWPRDWPGFLSGLARVLVRKDT